MDPRAAASAVAPAQLRACAPCLTDIARSPYIQFEARALGCGSIAMKGDTMNSNSETMVTGLFADRAGAERAYQSAASRGYGKDDVNLVMSDETRKQQFAADGTAQTELGTKAAEGAGVGGAIGGTIGAVLAAIAAIGTSIAIPGLGLVIAGPLAGGLAGAGAGALSGGLIGALVGWGIPEEHAKRNEAGIKSGGIVMGVRPRSQEDGTYLQRERATARKDVYRSATQAQRA